jgi:hypothetical protein
MVLILVVDSHRVIVPGYAAVRNVKWLKKLELAEEEAFGTWQRGLNYKILPPTVLDAKEVDLDIMPGLSEECVFSGITRVENLSHTPVVAQDGAATTATTLEDEIFGSMSVGRGLLGGGPRTPLTPGETVFISAMNIHTATLNHSKSKSYPRHVNLKLSAHPHSIYYHLPYIHIVMDVLRTGWPHWSIYPHRQMVLPSCYYDLWMGGRLKRC